MRRLAIRARAAALVLAAALVVLGLMLLTAQFLTPPAAAAASTYPPWEEGTSGHPFHLREPVSPAVSVLGTDDRSLSLGRETLVDLDKTAPMWDFWPSDGTLPPDSYPDPRMAYPLSNGNVLVSGGRYVIVPYVMEVDRSGVVKWEYKNGVDGLLRRPFSAEPARFGGRDCVLISDRDAYRVFAVDKVTKKIVWQYGTTDVPGPGVDQLADPFCATQLPPTTGQTDGNVLIADSFPNHRVIEVRSDDYRAAAPDLGYNAASIVWQYGVTGQAGSEPGYVNRPRSPQRLSNGNTLIADSVGKQIIEVRTSDYDPLKPNNGYTAASIVWSYVNGVDGPLLDPNTARYVEKGALAGSIVFTDCDVLAQRVRIVRMDESKATLDTFDMQTFAPPGYVTSSAPSAPRDARIAADGSLWIADAAFAQVLQVGNEGSGTVTSTALDCGSPNLLKAFDRLKIEAPAQPAGTTFALWYSVDGKALQKLKLSSDGRNAYFQPGTVGRTFTYKVAFASTDRWAAPALEGLMIHFSKAKTGPGTPGGGSDKPGGSGNSGRAAPTRTLRLPRAGPAPLGRAPAPAAPGAAPARAARAPAQGARAPAPGLARR